MLPFATEFPIRSTLGRADFAAQVIAWLRGSPYSTLLDGHQATDFDREVAHLQAHGGEELHMREFEREGRLQGIGFRHDYPDGDGRLWRTEAVVRLGAAGDNQHLIRLRTQCIARKPGAHLEVPRKPYFLKTIIRDGYGGTDGVLDIADQPIWLGHDDVSVDLACAMIQGQAQSHLPVVYISATGERRWPLSQREIGKLAYELGGVAHVAVEPNLDFSFQLRDRIDIRNPYGGTVGVSIPGQGLVRRFYVGGKIKDAFTLVGAVQSAAIALRSQMPAEGWDWTELQEQALRRHRERDRNRLSQQEVEESYLQEINTLKEKISSLTDSISSLSEEKPILMTTTKLIFHLPPYTTKLARRFIRGSTRIECVLRVFWPLRTPSRSGSIHAQRLSLRRWLIAFRCRPA